MVITVGATAGAAARRRYYIAEMDRRTKLIHLAQARRHVAVGEEHVARQTELIAALERDGHDAREAQCLLARFIVLQTIHIDHCQRLERELSCGPT